MPTTITETIQREAPEVEALRLGLIQSGKTLADKPLQLPRQKIYGLSDLERQAIEGAGVAGGIGGYQQLAQGGRGTLGTGLGTMGRALGALSYAPGYLDASTGALGRSEQRLAGSTGQFGGGPGYRAQGFDAFRQGPAALGYDAGQFQGGPGYTAGQFQGGPGYTAGQFQGGPGYTAQGFDPSSASAYFNPYEDVAVQQALTDIRRQGDIARNQQNAAAVKAGAFGGSRQGLQSAELDRNVLEQQGRTAAGMRQAGFQTAMQQAQGDFADQQRRAQAQAQFGTSMGQQAFEDAQRRQQAQAQFGSSYGQQMFQNQQQAQQQAFEDQQRRAQAQAQFGTQFGQQAFEDQQRRQQAAAQQQQGIASMYGNLANTQQALAGQYGNIGQAQGNLGVQQLNAAQQAQQQGLAGLSAQQVAGGLERQVAQAALNTAYQNDLRQLYEPQTRLSWLSDIYKGAPSSQSAIGSQVSPQAPTPSAFQQVAGLGTGLIGAAAGAKQIGTLFN